MPARRAARKADHRIRDGKRSNDALARRGSLTPRVDRAALQAWSSRGPARRGARPRPRDAAIECPPAPRAIYHPPPRATEGLARSIVGLMGLDPPVPDSSTPGRRAATVRITPPGRAAGPLHPVPGDAGLKAHGEGGWEARQHGHSRRRARLTPHRATDPEPHETRAAVVSEPGVVDAEAVPSPPGQVDGPIVSASADGMYDRRAVYDESERRGARAVIPPRRDAAIRRHGNCSGPRLARDEDLRRIRRVGREGWERESGDHRRPLAETARSRLRTIFGGGVSSREDGRRATEVGIRCRALSIMTRQGMPRGGRVAA